MVVEPAASKANQIATLEKSKPQAGAYPPEAKA